MSGSRIHEVKVEARGRICLFGDHQDYLGFPVIASTIDRKITIVGKANASGHFYIDLPDICEKRKIDPKTNIDELDKRDYLLSGIKVMIAEGLDLDRGYDITISGNIPINSGLSSSSAFCVAWIIFLVKAFSFRSYSPLEIGALAYKTEVTEHGEPGGIMDQYTIAHDALVHIDTGAPYRVAPIDFQIPGLLIADSGQEKGTLEVLKKAKEGGLKALDYLKKTRPELSIESARSEDVQELLEHCPFYLRPYLNAAIANHDITKDALTELNSEDPDLKHIGAMLTAHQSILREDLGVSTSVLDGLIVAAEGAGALGAKLIGSGGGGCVLALAPRKEKEVRQALLNAGAKEVFSAFE